jgi:hypothetical protein
MKKALYVLSLFWLSGWLSPGWAQKKPSSVPRHFQGIASPKDLVFLPGDTIICYRGTHFADTRIGPPGAFLQRRDNRSLRTSATAAEISVEYINFPDSARRAFQYAVDIWKSLIVSDVPIRIRARWQNLGGNVLGSAGPTSYVTGFSGMTQFATSYPIALAEKLARRNLNGDTPDISASFNSSFSWYYGTDGPTRGTGGREDLVSTVLHEIGHGLGFVSSRAANPSAQLAAWGDEDNFGFPYVYDIFMENAAGQQLISEFANPSRELYTALTNNNLFFDSPIMTARNNNQRAKLYAPASYSAGSSTSHLDEGTYRQGDPNSAMTPTGNPGEVIHNPGPITLNMFTDMGWRSTSVLHDRLRDSEDLVGQPITFRARVLSDTTLKTPVQLSYTINDTTRTRATTVTMTAGANGEYAYTLPAASTDRTIRYWIAVEDNSNRRFSSPAEAPQRFYWTTQAAVDRTAPDIRHAPTAFIFASTDTIRIAADVFENFDHGIDTTYIEYRINGVAQPSRPLPRIGYYYQGGFITSDILVRGALTFAAGTLKGGDRIEYRLVSRDRARTPNVGYSPATGYYTVNVVGLNAVATSYQNNFDAASTDFIGNGFSITTPAGFNNGAIHSTHPYPDGLESENFRSNYVYQLLTPIRLTDQNPTIRFDEIVLVEPGDPGSIFGSDDFYDYVVVEGSRDGGKTWIPFQEGWDSRDQAVWKTAYDSRLDANNNSTAVGTPSLYRSREIATIGSGVFSAGETVLIRFRLFADQLAHGWGWAIDNLQIQLPAPPPVTAAEPTISETQLRVYPNPSPTGEFIVEGTFAQADAPQEISVRTVMGQRVYSQPVNGPSRLATRLDLSRLAPGFYYLTVRTASGTLTKKITVTR